MLESIRERSGSLLVKILLVLIALTFALTGISGYITSTADPAVASVNGEDISRPEFDRAVENERNRQRDQLGDFYDQLAVDAGFNEQLRQRVINDLINQKLVVQYAVARGLRVSDEQVKEAIRNIPSFRVAGQFDNDTYQFTLRSLGYTPDGFAELMRTDLARSQLLQTLVDSEFALANETAALQALINQSRSGAYVTLSLADYEVQVEVSDELVSDWYQRNLAQFAIAEQVQVEYVSLDAADLIDRISVDEAVVEAWYENNRARFVSPSQYRFSHILIEGNDSDARTRAEQALAAVQQGGDFAELAKQYSDDLFSAEQGGDLDFIEPGTMDAEFEQAAFALTDIGATSGLVETSFGFHIIKLTDFIAGANTPLEQVRDEIVADLTEQQLKQAYYEVQQSAAQLAFEIPDSFAELAEQTGLTVQTSGWISTANAPAALRHPAVQQQLFNQQFIAEGLNSDLIETGDTTAVVVRVLDYQAAATKPLDDVRDTVVAAVIKEQAQQLAQADAQAIQAQLKAGEAIAQQLVYMSAVTRRSSEYPRAVISALFELSAPTSGTSQITTTTVTNGDIAVVQLTEVSAGAVDQSTLVQTQEQFINSVTQSMYAAFIEALRADAEIEIKL